MFDDGVEDVEGVVVVGLARNDLEMGGVVVVGSEGNVCVYLFGKL